MVKLLALLVLAACSATASAAAAAAAAAAFNISNTLGDGMVLQREPQSAMVWGFGAPGATVATSMKGLPKPLSATVDATGTWRQQLPPQKASLTPQTLKFTSGGTALSLKDVLFGDVFLCSGQSNMQCVLVVVVVLLLMPTLLVVLVVLQLPPLPPLLTLIASLLRYTPHSMAGMNNLTAELAAADAYGKSGGVRFFTVGQVRIPAPAVSLSNSCLHKDMCSC